MGDGGGGGDIVPHRRFFDRCILTGRALKLVLYDFSSNHLCDFVVRDIIIAVYLESPRKINFNLGSAFLSKIL